jgi:RND family efflux transporter MFP subunit
VVSRIRSKAVLAGVAFVLVAVVLTLVLPLTWSRSSLDDDQLADDGDVMLSLTPVPVSLDAGPAAAPSPTGRQSATVRRGSISELLVLSGRVAGTEEMPVSFPAPSRVESVAVTPGQTVEEGQELLKADQKEIVKSLDSARARVDAGGIRLAQAEAQAQLRQREADRRADAERTQRQVAIGEAEAGLRRAQVDYERVKAGAPAADRLAAAGAITSARAAVSRAESEVARLKQGPSEVEVQAADQQVWSTRLAVQRAETELERLRRGADPTDLRAADREVSAAQTALLRAQADLDRVSRPDPAALSAAERDVQRAELSVRVAESSGGKDKNARVAREASVRSARLSLQDAQERLARLRQGPPPFEVEAARRAVADARIAVQIATERREAVAKGPDEMALAAANQAVEAAKLAATNAEARYLALKAGPPTEQIVAAQGGLESAQAGLGSAIMRQSDVNSHPTRTELQDAEDRIAASQAAVDKARADAEQATQPADDDVVDPASYDLMLLRKDVEQDRTGLEKLERELAATRLLAPAAGVVASILVRPGDPLEPGRPAIILAKPGEPIVRSDLSERDTSRLTPGQYATVQVDGMAGVDLDAAVDQVEGAQGSTPSGRFKVVWPQTFPILGATAQVVVTLQRKDDVLIVPQRAVRTAGQRRFVEISDSAGRRNVDVQVGISQGGDVEIVSGLAAGQLVLIGP